MVKPIVERTVRIADAVITGARRPQTLPTQLREVASAWSRGAVPAGLPRPGARGSHAGHCRGRRDEHAGAARARLPRQQVQLVVRRPRRRTAGFGEIHAMNYSSRGADVDGLAEICVLRAHEVMAATGADRIHLVGHSLGGMVIRKAVQAMGLVEASSVVTVATPTVGSTSPGSTGSPGTGTRSARSCVRARRTSGRCGPTRTRCPTRASSRTTRTSTCGAGPAGHDARAGAGRHEPAHEGPGAPVDRPVAPAGTLRSPASWPPSKGCPVSDSRWRGCPPMAWTAATEVVADVPLQPRASALSPHAGTEHAPSCGEPATDPHRRPPCIPADAPEIHRVVPLTFHRVESLGWPSCHGPRCGWPEQLERAWSGGWRVAWGRGSDAAGARFRERPLTWLFARGGR